MTDPKTDPKTLVATLADSMSLTREVLMAQFKTLDASPPATPRFAVEGNHNPSTNAAALLNAVANSHLGGAAQTLNALSAAAARVREQWGADHGAPPSPTPARGNVIDAEIVAPTNDGAQ